MSTFVLIHGSWSGAWCWDKVVPLLRAKGHTVIAPDLPGHGRDKTPIADITLQTYVDAVCDILDQQSEPVILVGHSHGGIVITQVAEQRPRAIRALVYLAGFLPGNGESLLFWAQQDSDPERTIMKYVDFSPDQTYATIRPEGIQLALLNDCSEQDAAWAEAHYAGELEPLSSPATPVQVTAENYGTVARFYIETLLDNALSPVLQQQMYTASPCQEVIAINAGHSAFISQPQALAEHLISISKAITLSEMSA